MRFVLLLLMVLAATLPATAQDVRSVDNLFVADGLVYFNLRTGEAVPAAEKTETNWDILINGVEIHANRGGQLLVAAFDDVAESPVEGMKRGLVKTADGEQWYSYDMSTHVVTPKEGHTFVLMLADDSYAKLVVDSYYHRVTEDPRYLTFRYTIADDGSPVFGADGPGH
ncbi:MAG: HmuY family protein [Rhodothermales bacterium]|nr:HmuY family protein [Rhodothermales bacterium]MBO6780003.1 HmuY family protein [Rhodothermales bacterium]